MHLSVFWFVLSFHIVSQEKKDTKLLPILPQILTDFQKFLLIDSVINLQQNHV